MIVSTTGKISRELFEIREFDHISHNNDFLTVGSMGHSSLIALEIAVQNPSKKVWCIDGDGAVIMHMGAMAIIGSQHVDNFIHVVLNNAAHESVGGMPTAAQMTDLTGVARSCGYSHTFKIKNNNELENILPYVSTLDGTIFIEIFVSMDSRNNLGRPTMTPYEIKTQFMKRIKS